jgi:hypothetical protein
MTALVFDFGVELKQAALAWPGWIPLTSGSTMNPRAVDRSRKTHDVINEFRRRYAC